MKGKVFILALALLAGAGGAGWFYWGPAANPTGQVPPGGSGRDQGAAPQRAAKTLTQAHQQAEQLAQTNPRAAMEVLEKAIAAAPDDPQAAKAYLLLGKLKLAYERASERGYASYEEMRKYLEAHPQEYYRDEISDEYLYNGYHFDRLIERFPRSELMVAAAYEKTKLSVGGECEGWTTCYMERGFFRIREFLEKFPESKDSPEAVGRANQAFRSVLWGTRWSASVDETKEINPREPSDYYDPEELRKLIQQYEDVAARLAPRLRASAYETIAHYHARLGETDQARQLYTYIIREVPDYPNLVEVRKSLASLP